MTETETGGRIAPTNAIEDTKNNRWWIHPVTGERFLRVTTALRAVAKDALVPWSAYLAARAAMANLPMLVSAMLVPDCGNSYNRCRGNKHQWDVTCERCPCRRCARCCTKWLAEQHIAESSRRADEGTCTHRKIQHWIETGQWDVQPEMVDGVVYQYDKFSIYVDAFRQFLDDHELGRGDVEYSEAKVINREFGYAGTTDMGIWFPADRNQRCAELNLRLGQLDPDGRVLLMVDTKTREKTAEQDGGVKHFLDHALQLVGYRRCSTLMLPNGDEVQTPPIDGTAILQLRPDGYDLRPTLSDDEDHQAFCAAITLYRWTEERGPKTIAASAFPLPEDYRRNLRNTKARQKRADKKTTAGVATRLVQTSNGPASKPDTAQRQRECRDPFCATSADPCGLTPQAHLEMFTQLGVPFDEVKINGVLRSTTADGAPATPLASRILGVPPEQLHRYSAQPGATLTDSDIPF